MKGEQRRAGYLVEKVRDNMSLNVVNFIALRVR
jgi:hypothetical protein